MNIEVWSNFSKRKNSTKQPSSAGTIIDVKLKNDCSIENPVFILQGAHFDYNYIKGLGHYYFVDDIVSLANNLIEIHCTQDLLATYKAEILDTNVFVEYDTTANTEIIDSRLSINSTATLSTASTLLRDDISGITPQVIVALLGTNGVGYYSIPLGNLPRLFPDFNDAFEDFLDEDNPFGAYKALIKALMKTGANASEYIKDIIIIPFVVPDEELAFPLMIGNYELSIGGNKILTRRSEKNVFVNIPWQFSDWRNNSPYTDLHMYIPFVGNISLPASQLIGTNQLCVQSSLDRYTGSMTILVRKGSQTGEIIGSYSASTGVSMMTGVSGMTGTNVINGVLSAVGSASAMNVGGMVGAGLSAITPVASTIGSTSSYSAVGVENNIKVYTVCHNTNILPSSVSAVMGTPAFATKSLGTLSGFVKTRDASINIACFGNDKDIINGLLNSGIFIE